MEKVVIIGSGPSGLTAGIYASRAMLSPTLITGKEIGGQLMTTTDVENFPGFPDGVMGPKLMIDMKTQAEKYGTKMEMDEVEHIKIESDHKVVVLKSGKEIPTKTVIIATGASARYLNLDNEASFVGKGLHTCATCDGNFYKGKNIIVVGGGDSAMEEANYLSNIVESITMIHRSDKFRASKVMLEKVKNNPKINLIPYRTISKYIGDGKLTSVEITNTQDDTTEIKEVDGVFIAIGHNPNTSFLGDQITLDELKYISNTDKTHTNIEGIFSSGDVSDTRYKQAITAAGFGCMAALDAQKYLEEQE